jgi:hypothetical protein
LGIDSRVDNPVQQPGFSTFFLYGINCLRFHALVGPDTFFLYGIHTFFLYGYPYNPIFLISFGIPIVGAPGLWKTFRAKSNRKLRTLRKWGLQRRPQTPAALRSRRQIKAASRR